MKVGDLITIFLKKKCEGINKLNGIILDNSSIGILIEENIDDIIYEVFIPYRNILMLQHEKQ